MTSHSPEFERGLIGCALTDADRVMFLAQEEGVGRDWFYQPQHAALWGIMADMFGAGRPIDLMTVCDRVRANKAEEAVGGESNIERMIDNAPTVHHAEYFIEELRKHRARRVIYRMCREAAEASKDAERDPADVLAELLRSAVDLGAKRERRTPAAIAAEIETQWQNALQGVTTGVMTPWPSVNKLLGGAQPREVTLVAGRGGMGKSSLLATWVEFLGRSGVPIGYLPFEDGIVRTTKRLAGIWGQFSVFHCDRGQSPETTVRAAVEHVKHVTARPVHMEDRPMTAAQILGWGMTMRARHGIKAIFIDAFKDVLRTRQDVEADNVLSTELTNVARRLDIPAIVCHHIRKGGVHEGRFTRLTDEDLRGSGKIKDDARQVMILQCENVGSPSSPQLEFELEIAKSNFGPTGSVKMERISKFTQWVERKDTCAD